MVSGCLRDGVGRIVNNSVYGRTFDEDVFAKATLVVPAGSEEAYRNAEVWKKFSSISNSTDIKPFVVGSQNEGRIYDLRGVEMKSEKGICIKGGKVRVKAPSGSHKGE